MSYAKVELFGVGVLDVWIEEVADLFERCGRGEVIARSGAQGILDGDGWGDGSGVGVVGICYQLTDVRPGAFDVLSRLHDAGVVVEHDTEGAADDGLIVEAIGKAEAGSEVRVSVVWNLATGIDDDVGGK